MSRYTVFITPTALNELRNLPGNMRQRLRRAVQELAETPRPGESKMLNAPADILVEVRRLRVERWLIIYTLTESDQVVDVLAVRKRPPYDYSDLAQLLAARS